MEAQTFRSVSKKRTTNFREDETKLLIQLWGSPQIQNKLYLTHRKEPVMRLLAASMQQRGFYRTPDEIKTRIRNLKCLYHRIKRTVQSGSGIGTVDPDWPHYKAMDAILSKVHQKKESLYRDNVFEGPMCEDIKQEIDDVDINDDLESFTTNSMAGSEYEEEHVSLPRLTPAPTSDPKKYEKNVYQNKPLPKILPNITTFPLQNQNSSTQNGKQGPISSLGFPLLILNGMPNQATPDKKDDIKVSTNSKADSGMTDILQQLVDIQRESLEINKQRIELEKQKFEFERFVATQLLALGPVFSGILQRCSFPNNTDLGASTPNDYQPKNGRKRPASPEFELFKDSKILKTILTEGLKKCMMNYDNESDNEDSGTQNDENSRS